MKKYIAIILITALVVAGYVFFTLKSGKELNEKSPLTKITTSPPSFPTPEIKDSFNTMNAEMNKQFAKEVALMKNQIMQKAETMPVKADIIAQGNFQARAHAVEGKALFINTDNQATVRFENFKTDNGPRLHIYLSADLSADDFVDLGQIRATKGNVNYIVPSGTDLKKYHYVLVWCKPFSVLFSYANVQ